MIKRSGTLPSAIKALTDAMTRVSSVLEDINKRIPDKPEQQRMMVVRGLVESVNGPEALVRAKRIGKSPRRCRADKGRSLWRLCPTLAVPGAPECAPAV